MNPDNKKWKNDKSLLEEAYTNVYSIEEEEVVTEEEPVTEEPEVLEEQAPAPDPFAAAPAAAEPAAEPAAAAADPFAEAPAEGEETEGEAEVTEAHVDAALDLAVELKTVLAGGDQTAVFDDLRAKLEELSTQGLEEANLETDMGGEDEMPPVGFKATREDLKDSTPGPGGTGSEPSDDWVNPDGQQGGSGVSRRKDI